jgi:hypothetical protein
MALEHDNFYKLNVARDPLCSSLRGIRVIRKRLPRKTKQKNMYFSVHVYDMNFDKSVHIPLRKMSFVLLCCYNVAFKIFSPKTMTSEI